jgi:ABC-type antimicrobial peptide transport system permease subunit
LTDRTDDALGAGRFNLALIATFALLAMILAAVGIYGSIACGVQERSREFGVRLALGARPRRILLSALWDPIQVGIAGSLLGTIVAIVLGTVLGNALYLVPGQHGGLLYGVKSTEPLALAGASLALITVTALSGFIPALQAMRTDPLSALRTE